MEQPPVPLGALDGVPPGLRYRIRDVLRAVPGDGGALDGVTGERLARLLEDGEPWLGADPSLAEVGYWMIEPRHTPELRARGCAWLAMFPSVETARRLAALALDEAAPPPVREQAIAALGRRQLRALHAATRWPVEAIQLADEALVKLADAATAAGKVASGQLPIALRHVQWEGASAVFARAPGLWGEAIEAFATPALARVLLVCLEDMPPQHRARAIRLVAAVLGEEAVPLLLVRAKEAALDQQLEMLFAVIALAGEAQLPALEAAIKRLDNVDRLRARAKWHLKQRGVLPTVRGLRVARATATLALDERAAKCAQAADDLGVLTKFARHGEAYLYGLWGWMVRGASDPARARELVAAHPESQRLVRDLYLEDLARRGRVKQLVAAAQTLHCADLGALQLAIYGRPLAALELATTARTHTPELACARSLACYRAGRPDLAVRVLAEDPPPAELVDDAALPAFPGPHERWLVERAPGSRPAVDALVRGRDAVIALAKPAPFDAEPDAQTLAPIGAVARRLGRALAGATVYLAGELGYVDKAKLAKSVEAAGARVVHGPFPGTDFYVRGDGCPPQTVAQLERQGARRLNPGELEGM
ncbi:MAG TPA: hypothetical protein VMJ10_18585 [Kofleriaceae bacterium]|nr:hypothetical protein [Kofleriaceae bacterium]